MLFPAFFGIVMCATCLVGLTLAWFTATVETPNQKIVASNFYVETTVTNDSGDVVEPKENEYTLAVGTYTVEITPTGNGSGYCKVTVDGAEHYTVAIKGQKIAFTLEVTDGEAKCTITPVWGTYSGEADIKTVLTVPGTVTPDEIQPTDPTDTETPVAGGEDTTLDTEAPAPETTPDSKPEDTTETQTPPETSADTESKDTTPAPDTEAEETEAETTPQEEPAPNDDGEIGDEIN